MPDDLRQHFGVADEGCPGTYANAVGDEQHLVEGHRIPGIRLAAIDGDLGAFLDPVALGAVSDDRVHGLGDLSEQKKSPRITRDVRKVYRTAVLTTAVRSVAR